MFPDYYTLIPHPICMNQIKRKFSNQSYTSSQFRADMLQLFQNAKTYNEDGSWVFNAAQEMQETFERRYDEEMARLNGDSAGNGLGKVEDDSAGASGTSTPMFKGGAAPIPPRIKITVGQSRRQQQVVASESEGDDDDDDYDE